MGIIGYIPINHPTGRIDIPIVGPGESILPSRVRARRPSVGELSLVYPEDIRASPVMVRQASVTYAVARDPRTSIEYAPNRSISMTRHHSERGSTTSALIARTYFNRVTRIEATLQAGANSWCVTWDIDQHFEETQATAWIRVVGPVTRDSSPVVAVARGHHPGFSASWQTGWRYATGSVVLDGLPPGTYDVYLYLRFDWDGLWHSGSNGDVRATCQTWTEIARG